MPKPKKADEVFQILREQDAQFQIWENRGKGSHRMIYHPSIDGQPRSCPVPYHKGHDVKPGILRQIIRRFNLRAERDQRRSATNNNLDRWAAVEFEVPAQHS